MNKTNFLFYLILFVLIYSCDNRRIVFAFSDNANSLSTNTDVEIKGIKVGVVDDIQLMDDRRVLFTLEIDKEIEIPIDEKFVVKQIDFLGNRSISIEGGQSRNLVSDGDTINLTGITKMMMDTSSIDEVSNLINELFGNNLKDSILFELKELNHRLDSLSKEK